MMYRVEYMRPESSNWTLAYDGNSQTMMISRAKSVARERSRDKVRVVDENGMVVWTS